MDKKEFYKELMLTYTVDTEKIKCNAKRRNVKRGRSNIRMWTSTVAACAAVTAAAVAVVSLNVFNTGGLDITETDSEAAVARLMAAEQYYAGFSDNQELMDMYISFESALKYREILLAFSAIDDYGQIVIDLLYTGDGQYFEPAELTDDNMTFTGVKATAPGSLCKEIRLLKTVSLVELAQSGITDDTFCPFGSSQLITAAAAPLSEPIEITMPTITSLPEETGTSAPSQDTPGSGSEEGTLSPDSSDPSVNNIPQDAIVIPVADVSSVNFISADKITVTTPDSIRLYRLTDSGLMLETTFYASNAKISWLSNDGTKLFITACENGSRSRLYFADGNTGTLSELDISSITSGGAEISSVACNSDGSIVVLKTVSLNNTCICFARRTENSLIISPVSENGSPVTVLSYSSGVIYSAVTDTQSSAVRIVASDTESGCETEIISYSGVLRCTRSSAFDAAALTFTASDGTEEYVLLTPDGSLIPTESGNITFSETSGRIYTDGKAYFSVSDGEINEISADSAAEYFIPASKPTGSYEISEDGTAYLIL